VVLDYEKLMEFVRASAEADGPNEWRCLSLPPRRKRPRLVFRCHERLRECFGNKTVRHKLVKFLRDNFKWPRTERIEFYSDYVPYSFFFREFRGDTPVMCGGVILHGQGLNQKNTPLMVNSFYIIDDEKQRAKMTEEFYAAVKKEIAEYQERADYFIKSGSQSPAVMDRWVLKIRAPEGKKKHYEGVLRRELDGLDDEFNTLKFLAQELQVRTDNIRLQKAA